MTASKQAYDRSIASEMSWPYGDAISIVSDPLMGRCLEARAAFAPGTLLWSEDSYVHASGEPDDQSDMAAWREVAGKSNGSKSLTAKTVKAMMKDLVKLRSVGAPDIARCLLQLVARFLQLQAGGQMTMGSNVDVLFSELQPSNKDRCFADISSFRSKHKGAFSTAVSTETIAHLLGILNSNQMELGDIGGTGLFVATAICEHSCFPNCSFSTQGSQLRMVVTRDVAVGDRISIDYGNNFYRATYYRKKYLYEIYNFVCQCSWCIGFDRYRSFCCQHCPSGSLFALNGAELDDPKQFLSLVKSKKYDGQPDQFSPPMQAVTPCDSCGAYATAEAVQRMSLREAGIMALRPDVEDISPDTLANYQAAILRIRAERILKENHYLLFWAVSNIADVYSEFARLGLSSYEEAIRMAVEVSNLLDSKLPQYHEEKMLQFDKIGQLAVAGNQSMVIQAFQSALDMSLKVHGSDHPTTTKFREIVASPPTNVEELYRFYDRNNCDDDPEAWEDDDDDEEPSDMEC
jgi:hypothetical protein